MKILSLILITGLLASCSSVEQKKRLAEKVKAEEVRSFQEIKNHSEILLEDHPELDNQTKSELRSLLHATMKNHQELKDQESQIFHLLLEKSLRVNQLTDQEVRDKAVLKSKLASVYDKKLENANGLIKRIVELSQKKAVSESFQNDLMIYMRDFR